MQIWRPITVGAARWSAKEGAVLREGIEVGRSYYHAHQDLPWLKEDRYLVQPNCDSLQGKNNRFLLGIGVVRTSSWVVGISRVFYTLLVG